MHGRNKSKGNNDASESKGTKKTPTTFKLTEIYELIEEVELIREKMDKKREALINCSLSDRAIEMGVNPLPTIHMRCAYVLKAHSSRVHDAFWSPNDDYIISVGSENCIVIWNTQNGYIHNVVDASLQQPVAADVTPDMKNIFCGGLCARVVIYKRFPSQKQQTLQVANNVDLDTSRPVSPAYGDDCYSEYDVCNTLDHDSNILQVKYLGNNILATIAEQEGLTIWDVEKTKKKYSFKTTVGQSTSFICLHNPKLYVTGSTYGTIHVWDERKKDGEVIMIEAHESDISCLANLPSSHNFLSGSDDTFVQLFDTRMDQAVARYSDPVWRNLEGKIDTLDSLMSRPDLATVNTVAATPSGRMFFTGCGDGFMYFWDTLHTEESILQREEGGPVRKLSFSKKGSALINVVWDSRNRIKIMMP